MTSVAQGQDQKLPEPDSAALEKAEATIKTLYRADFARKGTTEMREFAVKLITQATETLDDNAARFVLFREGAVLAARAGDFDSAFQVIDELAQQFETDGAALKLRVVKAGEAQTTVARRLVADAALLAVRDAFASSEPKSAEELIAIAAGIGTKLKSAELKAAVDARRGELKEVVQEFEKYQEALKTLQSMPGDAAANLIAGKYACFIKGDWKAGLAYLVKSNDAALKSAATKDLANPEEPAALVELADAWWDIAESVAVGKRQVLGRAAQFYGDAVQKLQGLTQAKVRDRLAAIEKQYPGSTGAAPFTPFAGIWEVKYTNTAQRLYLFDNRGNFFHIAGTKFARGRLVPSGEQMQLAWERNKLEKMIVKNGEMFLSHYNPPTRLSTTGVGTKIELPENRPGAARAAAADFRDIAGTWLGVQSDTGMRIYVFDPKGSGVYCGGSAEHYEGVLTRKDDHIVFDPNDGRMYRFKKVAGTFRVDLFDPPSSHPDGKPKVGATLVRLAR